MKKTAIVQPVRRPLTGNFSPAIRAGNTLYISGQGPLDIVKGGVVSGTIEEETIMTLDHIKHLVELAGGTLDSIVKCTVWLADLDDFEAYNNTYLNYFKGTTPPARSTVQSGLLRGIKIEIEAVAVLDEEV